MLLNEGEYGNARLLAPHTVRLMTSNALPPDVGYADIARRMGDIGPTPEMGQGFGLGFRGSYRGGTQPATWLDRQFLLDRGVGYDLLGRSQGEGDRYPNDPDPVDCCGSTRP